MRIMFKTWATLTMLVAISLGGCKDDDDAITVDDAKDAAESAAGRNAVDCGTVGLQESRAEANCCMATNLAQSMPAYALYVVQGIDSAVATAVAINNAQVVSLFSFSGGYADFVDPVEGVVVEQSCRSIQLIDDACNNSSALPFLCS